MAFNFGSMFAQWQSIGVFTYVLPFLLIFAIVYSVLSVTRIFKGNQKVAAVVSLAVALLALQFNVVAVFFAEIFPRMGVAISVILVIIILISFFRDPTDPNSGWVNTVLGIIVAIILIVIVSGSLGGAGMGVGLNLGFLNGIPWGTVLGFALIIGAIFWIIGSNNKGR
jgi:hypothetical protein